METMWGTNNLHKVFKREQQVWPQILQQLLTSTGGAARRCGLCYFSLLLLIGSSEFSAVQQKP
eukprot:3051970-Amphidinium_carterae.2